MAYTTQLTNKLTNNYIPTRPKKKMNKDDRFDLYDRLLQMIFDEVIENSDLYFETVKITNFDLINHQCEGTELSHSKEYYQTIFKEKLDLEIIDEEKKSSFISSSIQCHRDDVFIEKKIIDEHFIQNLEKKKVVLSNMRRMKFKKTDD